MHQIALRNRIHCCNYFIYYTKVCRAIILNTKYSYFVGYWPFAGILGGHMIMC